MYITEFNTYTIFIAGVIIAYASVTIFDGIRFMLEIFTLLKIVFKEYWDYSIDREIKRREDNKNNHEILHLYNP